MTAFHLVSRMILKSMISCAGLMKYSPTLVLGYHDVAAEGDFSSWLKVPVKSFEQQLRFLSCVGNFIRPGDLFEPGRMRRNRLNVLLTFDDGFEGNFSQSYPVIRRLGIPALFFISTWNMVTGESFWFDRIIRLIQRHKVKSLDLRHLGMRVYGFSSKREEARWNEIQAVLEAVKRGEREGKADLGASVAAVLEQACGIPQGLAERDHCRPITPEQVLEMRRSGLCHFGSHSHRHGILKTLDDATLAQELVTSRTILEDLLGEAVLHVSYPNGDVDERVRQACLEAGYRYGYTTLSGCVDGSTNRMEIPRLLIGGYDSLPRLFLRIARDIMKTGKLSGRNDKRRDRGLI